jgi:hypothetical protein
MKRTIIYIFGPKRLSAKYYENKEIRREEGGWLKIGQTSEDNDAVDKGESAMRRIKTEVRTGIPEVCQLFDVFEFPYREGNNDDVIRTLLAEDIYTLESSKSNNREAGLDKYDIKAGREFIYGATRSQVRNALAKYERNQMLEYYRGPQFDCLMEMIQRNNMIEEEPLEPNVNEDTLEADIPPNEWCDKLWDRVIAKLSESINAPITNPRGRPYIIMKSETKVLSYVLGYSVRYGLASVSVETYQGEIIRDRVNAFIADNQITSTIENLIMKQGAKRKDKWAWTVSDTLDKPKEELVEWFVKTATTFHNTFEQFVKMMV